MERLAEMGEKMDATVCTLASKLDNVVKRLEVAHSVAGLRPRYCIASRYEPSVLQRLEAASVRDRESSAGGMSRNGVSVDELAAKAIIFEGKIKILEQRIAQQVFFWGVLDQKIRGLGFTVLPCQTLAIFPFAVFL